MENDPERARIYFDVPREHLPERMGELGSFVARHNIAITIADVPDEVADTEQVAQPETYDRRLVKMLPPKSPAKWLR